MSFKFYLFAILVMILFNADLFAKNNFQIKGNVRDEKTNEPLVGVNVLILQSKNGTVTDVNGDFAIGDLDEGRYSIRFSYLGYSTITKEIDVPLKNSEIIEIKLKETSIDLSEVVVTGNPFLVGTKNLSQSTVTLSKLDLLIKGSGNIADALNFQPGVSVRSNGVATARPVLRGFSNNKVLILEDGLRMGDLSSASDDHAISNDGSEAEKIEVIEGPSSLLYGSNAVGGVINIITDAIPSSVQQGLNGELLLHGGSVNNEYLGNAHINYGFGKFSVHTKIFKRKADDYKISGGEKTFNSDLDSYGSLIGISYFPNWGNIGASYDNFNNKYGLPSPPTSDEVVYIDMNKKQFRFNTDVNHINNFLTSMNLKAGYLDYNHKEISKIDGKIGTQFGMKTGSADLSFIHKPFFNNSNGVIGFYGLLQNFKVNGEEALTPNADYKSFAAYFLENFNLGDYILSAGARYELNSVTFPSAVLTDSLFEAGDKIFNSLSISLGAAYKLNDNISLFTSVANAFRAPTIEELSSFGIHEALASFDIGNKQLQKENSIGFDIGIKIQEQSFDMELTGYYNKVYNLIFRKPLDIFYSANTDLATGKKIGFNSLEDGFRIYEYNQADANVYGFETKIRYEIINGFTSTLISDYVRAKNLNTNENLPQIPPFRLSVELRYTTAKYWLGTLINLAASQNDVAPNEEPTAGYGLVSFYLGTKILSGNNAHIINLKIDNLFDKAYKDHLSAIKDFTYMPGRNISLNYKFIF